MARVVPIDGDVGKSSASAMDTAVRPDYGLVRVNVEGAPKRKVADASGDFPEEKKAKVEPKEHAAVEENREEKDGTVTDPDFLWLSEVRRSEANYQGCNNPDCPPCHLMRAPGGMRAARISQLD